MVEDKIWTEIGKIRSDVTEIKEALLGDAYGNPGYKDRVSELEDTVESTSSKVNNLVSGAKAFGVIIGLVASAVGVFEIFIK